MKMSNLTALCYFRQFITHLIAVSLAAIFYYVTYPNAIPILLNTKLGTLRALKLTTTVNTRVLVAYGIPYAKPPTGEYRFKAPRKAEPWYRWKILDATKPTFACLQNKEALDRYRYNNLHRFFQLPAGESEDCLYLNIWVPLNENDALSAPGTYPVAVIVHAGSMMQGSAMAPIHDGSIVATLAKCIVVVVNYRLGVFGLLDAGIPDAPGNQALLDQRMALQWVQDHIDTFGGNPKWVTIMGAGSGAVCASLHLESPLSWHLFNRVILSGGVAILGSSVEHRNESFVRGNSIAQLVNCSSSGNMSTEPKKVVDCLRKVPAADLLKAQSDLSPSWAHNMFRPTIGNEFLPTFPANRTKSTPKHNIMMGISAQEGSLFLRDPKDPAVFQPPDISTLQEASQFTLAVLKNFDIREPRDKLNAYFVMEEQSPLAEIIQIMVNAVTDVLFYCPSVEYAIQKTEQGSLVYFYVFAYRSPRTPFGKWAGTPHGTDSVFMYGIPLSASTLLETEKTKTTYNTCMGYASCLAGNLTRIV